MQLTERVSFKNGTLEGASIPANPSIYTDLSTIWVGPKVGIFTSVGGTGVAAGGSSTVTIYYQGQPAYGGNGWTAGAPYSGTLTPTAKLASLNSANATQGVTKTVMPSPPITFTFSPASIEIPSGSLLPVPITFTINIPTGTPAGTWLFKLEATDGRQVINEKIEVTSNPALLANYGFNITPAVPILTIAPGTQQTITFTFTNYGYTLGSFNVEALSAPAGITLSRSPDILDVPTGTPTTPGVATFTVTLTAASGAAAAQGSLNINLANTNPYNPFQNVPITGYVVLT